MVFRTNRIKTTMTTIWSEFRGFKLLYEPVSDQT